MTKRVHGSGSLRYHTSVRDSHSVFTSLFGARSCESEIEIWVVQANSEFSFLNSNLVAASRPLLLGSIRRADGLEPPMNAHCTTLMSDGRETLSEDRSHALVDEYASLIKRYDLLEPTREQQLARRWQEHRDRRATDALVTSHLRLAAKVARRYQRYDLPLADLIGEANLGLVIAASHFEPGHGARFSTYALWWIKAALHDYILRSRSLVKIGTTAAQRKLFFGFRRAMSKLGGDRAGLTQEVAEAVARELVVPIREVIEMSSRLTGDVSLNAPVSDDGPTEWEAMVVEQDESAQKAKALRLALGVLSARERRVFEARRLREDPPSLEELGRELSISGERVR